MPAMPAIPAIITVPATYAMRTAIALPYTSKPLLSPRLLALPSCVILDAWETRRANAEQRDILCWRVRMACNALHFPVLAAAVDAFLPYEDMEAPVQWVLLLLLLW